MFLMILNCDEMRKNDNDFRLTIIVALYILCVYVHIPLCYTATTYKQNILTLGIHIDLRKCLMCL